MRIAQLPSAIVHLLTIPEYECPLSSPGLRFKLPETRNTSAGSSEPTLGTMRVLPWGSSLVALAMVVQFLEYKLCYLRCVEMHVKTGIPPHTNGVPIVGNCSRRISQTCIRLKKRFGAKEGKRSRCSSFTQSNSRSSQPHHR
jgi:hypothetical protein